MTTETDQQFLTWIHGRLERVHNEPALADYMHRLRAIILSLPPGQITGGLVCNSSKELEQMIGEQRKRQPEKGLMTTEHPITPPPELVRQWVEDRPEHEYAHIYLADQAACWGWEQRGGVNEAELQEARDQEREACCEWLEKGPYGFSIAASAPGLTDDLRAARRPPAIPETIEVDGHIYRLVK